MRWKATFLSIMLSLCVLVLTKHTNLKHKTNKILKRFYITDAESANSLKGAIPIGKLIVPEQEHEEYASRRHFPSLHTHHPHHYLIGPEPVHSHHHHHHHGHNAPFYGFGDIGNHDDFAGGHNALNYLPSYSGDFHSRYGPFYSNFQGVHLHPHSNRHSFDEIFHGGEEEIAREGLRVHGGADEGIMEEDESDASLNSLAARLDGDGGGYGLGMAHHAGGGYRLGAHGFNPFGSHRSFSGAYNGNIQVPIIHDDYTDGIVEDLTHGNDINKVHGTDQVNVHGHYHGHHFGGWASQPYTYGSHGEIRHGHGDFIAGHGGLHGDEELHGGEGYHRDLGLRGDIHGRGVVHDSDGFHGGDDFHGGDGFHAGDDGFHGDVDIHAHPHNPYEFHYPTYEYPLHGNVVSEKDAKRIGLYDETYLKNLGIWEEVQSGGGSAIGGGGVIGGGGTVIGGGGGCQVPADVGFLFDGTKTGEGDKKKEIFSKYIEFAKQIVDVHPPSIEGFHYGAVVYSDSGEIKFDFEKSYDIHGVKAELEMVKRTFPNKEGAALGEGLKETKEELFDETARDWVYQVLVILTDTKGEGEWEKYAQQLRDSSVNIFVIGIANADSKADMEQMKKIATDLDKDHAFEIDVDKLLGTEEHVEHPKYLAHFIPDQVCRMDLVFVVDMKDKDAASMTAIKSFIKDSTAELAIGQYGNHIGLVGYGKDDASKEGWDLMSKWDRQQFQTAVDKLEDESGKSEDSEKALETALNYYLNENNEPRNGEFWRYLNVTILLTDRKLDGEYKAAAIKLRDHGVIIHSIGWKDASKDDAKESLSEVASDTDEFFLHAHDKVEKLSIVSKRMRQYFAQLLYGRQLENRGAMVAGYNSYNSFPSSSYSSSSSSSLSSSSGHSSSATSSGTHIGKTRGEIKQNDNKPTAGATISNVSYTPAKATIDETWSIQNNTNSTISQNSTNHIIPKNDTTAAIKNIDTKSSNTTDGFENDSFSFVPAVAAQNSNSSIAPNMTIQNAPTMNSVSIHKLKYSAESDNTKERGIAKTIIGSGEASSTKHNKFVKRLKSAKRGKKRMIYTQTNVKKPSTIIHEDDAEQ